MILSEFVEVTINKRKSRTNISESELEPEIWDCGKIEFFKTNKRKKI